MDALRSCMPCGLAYLSQCCEVLWLIRESDAAAVFLLPGLGALVPGTNRVQHPKWLHKMQAVEEDARREAVAVELEALGVFACCCSGYR